MTTTPDLTEAEFRERVLELAGFYGFSRNLPEIAGLLDDAADCLHDPFGYLQLINPELGISWDGLTLVIHEQLEGQRRVLCPWTIADYHLGSGTITNDSVTIVVDGTGTHFYSPRGIEIVRFRAGHCQPQAPGASDNWLPSAVGIISKYTDIDLKWKDLIGLESVEIIFDPSSAKWSITVMAPA